MKINIIKRISCAAMLLVLGTTVQATLITGEIDMSGTATLNNTLLGSATAATSFKNSWVGGDPTGAFAGTADAPDAVTWRGFGWSPPTTPSPNPLWTFYDTGTQYTYSFLLSSLTVAHQDNQFLNLLGSGTLTITGNNSPYDATTGDWSFTISNPNDAAHANFRFTFASSVVAVPEPTTVIAGFGALGLLLFGAGVHSKRPVLRIGK